MFKQWIQKKYLKLNIFIIIFLLPKTVFAEGGESPVGHGLEYFINNVVYGTDGTVISIIAVASTGLLCLAHKLSWIAFFALIAGMAIIFGAPAIVSGIKVLVSH